MIFVSFQGTTNVKATLLKDGHSFTVHILDPQTSPNTKDGEQDRDHKLESNSEVQNAQLPTDGKSLNYILALQVFLLCMANAGKQLPQELFYHMLAVTKRG